MITETNNYYIESIACTVPKNINKFKIPKNQKGNINRVKKVIGVDSSHITKDEITTLDLCINSSQKILKYNKIKNHDIDILVFVTQTPDYLMPSNANKAHKILNLKNSCICFDINLGCSGYVYGLWTMFSLMSQNKLKTGLLLVGDTISKTIKSKDFAHKMLFGDAGSSTLIKFKKNERSFFDLGTIGAGYEKLIMKNSGFRDKIFKPEFHMDGKEVFLFAIKNVPRIIKSIIKFAKIKIQNNLFIFHQANLFMLNKIFDDLKIKNESRLFSINKFGNTSSASIPLTMCVNIKKINKNTDPVVIAGFGAGFSYACAVINLNNCKIIKLLKI